MTSLHGPWRSLGMVAPFTARDRLHVVSSISRAAGQFVVAVAIDMSEPTACAPPETAGAIPSVAAVAHGRIVRAESFVTPLNGATPMPTWPFTETNSRLPSAACAAVL